MGIINRLDNNTVVKIAAGEVIERPASVVRELIDNAVDAGATHVSVSIASGGKGIVEVSDNGQGMDEADLRICAQNHTTSKIGTFDDILSLRTLGFRGEALASIAEVSELSIRSRPKGAIDGNILFVSYGSDQRVQPASRGFGTTVVVKDLFENIPARKKFLSTDAVETRNVDQEIQKKALAFPEIGFDFTVDGAKKYSVPARKTLLERIADFYPDAAGELLPVESERGGLRVTGYVTKPAFIRKNRLYQKFFVNRRFIEWKSFYFLLGKVYGNLLPEGFFCGAFVYLEIDPRSVDFNVHPAKKEARFEREQDVSKAVEEAVRSALLADETPNLRAESSMVFTPYEQRIAKAISGFFEPDRQAKPEARGLFSGRTAGIPIVPDAVRPKPHVPEKPAPSGFSVSPESGNTARPDGIEGLRFLGTAFRTYLIFEAEDRLLFVDQHAAHERINYEKLRENRERKIEPVEFLIPLNVDVPLSAVDELASHLDELGAIGFAVEHFGGNTFVVRGAPNFVAYETAADVVLGFAEALVEGDRKVGADFVDEALKQMACKASVRSGDNLSREEAYDLIGTLFGTQRPFSCPHGRPIIYAIDRKDVDKNFKRLGF